MSSLLSQAIVNGPSAFPLECSWRAKFPSTGVRSMKGAKQAPDRASNSLFVPKQAIFEECHWDFNVFNEGRQF